MDDDEEIFLPPTLRDDEETQAPSLRFAEADVHELASRREYGSRPGSSRTSEKSLGNAGKRANENGKELQNERELSAATDKARRVALARHEEKQAREAMIALYASIPHDFSLLMRSGDMGGSLKDTNPQLLRTSTHYGNNLGNSSVIKNKDNEKGRLVDALAREKTVVRAAFDSLLCQYSLREQNHAASGDTRSGSVYVDPLLSASNISDKNVAKDSVDRPSEAVECLVAEARRFISALRASTAVGSTSTDEPETSREGEEEYDEDRERFNHRNNGGENLPKSTSHPLLAAGADVCCGTKTKRENACSGVLLGEEGSDRDRIGQEEEQKHDAPIGRSEMAPPRELARHVSVCHNNSNTSIVQRSLARLHLTLLVNEGLKAQLNEALDEHRADLRNTQDVRGSQTHNGRVLARVSNTKQTRHNSDDESYEQPGDDDSTKTSTCIVSGNRRVIRPRAKDMVMRQILTRIGISGGRKDEEAPRAGQLFAIIRKSSASSGNSSHACVEDKKESCERTTANRWLPDGIHTMRSATAKTMLLRNSAFTLDGSSSPAYVGNSDEGGNRRGQDEKATAATSYHERKTFSLVCFPLLKRKSEIEKREELFKKDFEGIAGSFTNCLPPPLVTGDAPIDAAHWNAIGELTKSATKQQRLRMTMMMEKPWSTNSTAESSTSLSLSLHVSSWPFSSSSSFSSSLHIIIDKEEEAELREIIGSAAVDFLLMRSSSCSSSDSICGEGADADVHDVGCCANDDRLIKDAALAHLRQSQRIHGGGEGKGEEIATLRDLHFALLGGSGGSDGSAIRSKLGHLLKQHIGDTLRWATLKGKLRHSHAAHKKSTVATTSANSDGAASSVQAAVRNDIQSSSTNGRGSAASIPFAIDRALLIPPSEEDTLLPPPSLRYLRFERSYCSTTAKSSISSTNRDGRRSIGVNTKLSTTVGMRTFAPRSEYHMYHDADGQRQLQPTATAIRREFTDLAPLINNFLMPAQFPVGPQEARHRRVCEMIAARGATCFVLPFPITTDEGEDAGSSNSDGDSDNDNSRDDDDDDANEEEEDQFSAYASSFDDDGDGDDWMDAEMEEEGVGEKEPRATINKSPPSIAATIQQHQRLLIGKKGEEESSPAALRLGLEEGKRKRLFGYASPKRGDLEVILRQVSTHKRRKGQEGEGGKHPNDRDGDDLPIGDILQLQEKLGDVYLKSPFLTRNQWRVLRHVVRYEGFMSLHTVPDPQALIDEEEEEEKRRAAIDSEYADDDDERGGVDKQSWKERNTNKTARKKKKAFAELLSRLVLNREPPLSGRVIHPSLAAASISDLSFPSVAHSHSSKKKSKDATTKRWTSGEELPAPIFMSRPKSSFVKEWYNRRRRNGSNKREDERRGVQPKINGNGIGGVGYGVEQTEEEAKGGSYNGGHGGAAGHHDERTNTPAAASSVVAVDATDARHCQNDEGAFFQQPSVRCLYPSEVEALHAMGTAGGACPTTSATVLADLIPELGSYLCSQQIGNTDEATTAENEGRQHTINSGKDQNNHHTRQHPPYNLSMYSSTASSFAGRQLSYNRPSSLRYLPSYHQHTPQTPIGLTKNTYGHPFQMSALSLHDLLDASLLLRRNLRMLGLGPKKAEGVEKTATKKPKQKTPSVEAEEEKEEDRCRRLALGDAVDGGHVDRGVISVNASHVTIRLTGVKTTATTRTSTEKGASVLSSAPNSSAKAGGARRDASGVNNRVGGGGRGVSELTIPLCEIVEVVLGHSVGFLPTIRNAARCARRRAAELVDREDNGAAPLADSSDTASPYESAIRRLSGKGFSKEVISNASKSEEETSTTPMIRGGMPGGLFGIDSNAMRADGGQFPCDSIRGLTDRYYQCLTIIYAPAAHQQRARIAEFFDPNLLNNSNSNSNNRNRRNNNQQEKQQQQYPSRGAKHDGRMLFSGDAAAGDLIGDYIPLRESYVSVIIDSKSQWNAIVTAFMNSEVTITPNPSSAVHVSNVLLAHSSGSSSPTGATATTAAAGGRGAMGGLSAPSTTSSSASSSAYSGAIKRAIPIRFAGALPLSQLISNITATATEEVTDRDQKSRKEGTRSSPQTGSTKSQLLQKSAEENRAALAALKSDELAFCECFHINPIVYGKAKKHVLSRHCRPLKSFDSLTAVIDLDFFRLQQIVSFFESKGWVRLHTVYRNQKVKALH